MKVIDILRICKIAGRTIPSDMTDQCNKTYLSESKGEHIPIGEMDIVHLIRAFNKMKNDNEIVKVFNEMIKLEIIKRKVN
jgi:hypothetical protein